MSARMPIHRLEEKDVYSVTDRQMNFIYLPECLFPDTDILSLTASKRRLFCHGQPDILQDFGLYLNNRNSDRHKNLDSNSRQRHIRRNRFSIQLVPANIRLAARLAAHG